MLPPQLWGWRVTVRIEVLYEYLRKHAGVGLAARLAAAAAAASHAEDGSTRASHFLELV